MRKTNLWKYLLSTPLPSVDAVVKLLDDCNWLDEEPGSKSTPMLVRKSFVEIFDSMMAIAHANPNIRGYVTWEILALARVASCRIVYGVLRRPASVFSSSRFCMVQCGLSNPMDRFLSVLVDRNSLSKLLWMTSTCSIPMAINPMNPVVVLRLRLLPPRQIQFTTKVSEREGMQSSLLYARLVRNGTGTLSKRNKVTHNC